MTSKSSKISFKGLPVEIENTIWSYLDLHEKYPYTRVLNCAERTHLPEFKKKNLAIRDNEKALLVNFAHSIYNTFLNDNLYETDDNQQEFLEINSVSKDRDLLPKFMTTFENHSHPICNDINGVVKAYLFDDIKTVNGKPIVRKNTYIDEINKDKCTPDILHSLIHYFTNLRISNRQPWAIKFNKRMEDRTYKLTMLYRMVMKKFCKLRRANNVAFIERVALEQEERKKQKEDAREAAKQQKLHAKEADKQQKLQAKEAAKQQKLEAKEEAKQQKLEAKEAAKRQKLEAKEAAKQQKSQAKEQEKQQKLRAREAAKAELIAMKLADKEAKKIQCR